MFESTDFAGTPPLDYEAWRASVSSDYGDPERSEPNAFVAWKRPLSVCGFAAAAFKFQCGFGAKDAGCNAYHIKRTHRYARLAGEEHYCAVFPVAGGAAVIQNDQAVEFAQG